MQITNIFENPNILRLKWDIITPDFMEVAYIVSQRLMEIMEQNNFAWISPQNIVSEDINFYKRVLVLRDFAWEDFFQLINPSYEIIGENYVLMHELCWSVETIDSNPLGVLNLVPTCIKVTWLNSNLEEVKFTFEWITQENQEQISFMIHEINHIDWKIISDWLIIRKQIEWAPHLYDEIQKDYPYLLPSFLEFDGTKFIIHNLWENWIHKSCNKSEKNKTWESILPFHFDVDHDFDLLRSRIYKDWENYRISICSNCFE